MFFLSTKTTKITRWLATGMMVAVAVVSNFGVLQAGLNDISGTGGNFTIGLSKGGANIEIANDPWHGLGTIINYFLTIVGLVMLVMILYAGVILLMAQGNDEKVGEARKIITIALMGVIVISLAYALNSWVMSGITETPSSTT